ncbi:hypothetical protein EV426DRAFT_583181 [Tirmania nivea]|nr:hypothetical protein EV426DRAFT_583181 [Tirmania nivea]
MSTPTSQKVVERYDVIKARIQQAIEYLSTIENPNISAVAREFFVPRRRLQDRYNGIPSRNERLASNRKLTEAEELAVCKYIDRLDKMGSDTAS